ncbi:Ferredoxin-NADP reductase [Amycolatopsis marina]|uniref:Ferredoxin-NADP reductase n=1 Tax=Amycolatopsis marina TaxID=490629 RepID=A0A1I1CJS0_9PSEU|nr:FAD-binding oxidoreductase [Amycolatopsis marina]SFB62921.1 Ferredoxin-NADP reductase [Amycolatopsis marina]
MFVRPAGRGIPAPWWTRFEPIRLRQLATPTGVDQFFELAHPLITVRDACAEITSVSRRAYTVLSAELRPGRDWGGFRAGQRVGLTVDINGVPKSRCFSPVSSQHRADGRIELLIQADRGVPVARYLYRHAAPGTVVGLAAPEGEFTLPAAPAGDILLVSEGVGIAPVLSMMRTLADECHRGRVALMHHGSVPVQAEELAQLAAAGPGFQIHVETACGGAPRLDVQHLDVVAPWFREASTFLCGSPELARSARTLYRRHGIGDRLRIEDPGGPVSVGSEC